MEAVIELLESQETQRLEDLGVVTTGRILSTKRYELFKTHPVNRDIVEKKINSLVKDMQENGWQEGSFVVVDRDFVVINGQHRFESGRIVGLHIQFIQLDIKATAELIRRSNLNQMNWTLKNTIDGFAAEGHPEYKKIEKLEKMFPKLKSTDILMIAKLNTGSFKKSDIENGLLTVENFEKSIEWGNRIMALDGLVPGFNTRYFTRALTQLFCHPKFDFNRLLSKIEQYPADVKNWKQKDRNFEMLSDLYNKDLQPKNHINFKLV